MSLTLCTALLLAPQSALKPPYEVIARVPVQEHVIAIRWSHDSEHLYYATERQLAEWPGSRTVRFSLPDDTDGAVSGSAARLLLRGDGQMLAAFDNHTDAVFTVDLKTFKCRALVGDCLTAWWAGDELARLRPRVDADGTWTENQYIQIGTREIALLPGVRFTAVDKDGEVLLAKMERLHDGPIALYELDDSKGTVRKFREHEGPDHVEYGAQDRITWNPTLGLAAICLTSDTGASMAAPWLSSNRRCRRADPPESHVVNVYGQPEWVGDELLVVFVEFDEWPSGYPMAAYDRQKVILVNPRTNEHRTLLVQENRWDVTADMEAQPDRSSMPSIRAATISPDGRLLAYSLTFGSKCEVIICKL